MFMVCYVLGCWCLFGVCLTLVVWRLLCVERFVLFVLTLVVCWVLGVA